MKTIRIVLLVISIFILIALNKTLPVSSQAGATYIYDFTKSANGMNNFAFVTTSPCDYGVLVSGTGLFSRNLNTCGGSNLDELQIKQNWPIAGNVTQVRMVYDILGVTGGNPQFRAYTGINLTGTLVCQLIQSSTIGHHDITFTANCNNIRNIDIIYGLATTVGSNMELSEVDIWISGTLPVTLTPSPTATATNTPTNTPTNTETSTSTFTPTFTDTPTITLTPTPTYPPASYPTNSGLSGIGGCLLFAVLVGGRRYALPLMILTIGLFAVSLDNAVNDAFVLIITAGLVSRLFDLFIRIIPEDVLRDIKG